MGRLCGNSLRDDPIPETAPVRVQLLNLLVEGLVFVLAESLGGVKGKSTASDRGTRQTSAQALLSLVADLLEQEAKYQVETVSESGDKAAMERRHDVWRSPAMTEALLEFCKESNPSDTRRVAKHIQCVTVVGWVFCFARGNSSKHSLLREHNVYGDL